MGWRELCVTDETMAQWLLNQLRGWVLVVLVSWVAGWALVDYTLSAGAVQVAHAGGVAVEMRG